MAKVALYRMAEADGTWFLHMLSTTFWVCLVYPTNTVRVCPQACS